jgi:hypothetical protein
MKKRYKTKLEKLKNNHGDSVDEFKPQIEDVIRWFRIINREIFDSIFVVIPDIDIRRRQGAWAYFFYELDNKNPKYIWAKLLLNNRYKSLKHFVECLAHEMVHYYQAIHNEPPGHGPSFLSWKNKFNRKGLSLEISY